MTGAEIPVAMAVAPELAAGIGAGVTGAAATSAVAPIVAAAPEVAGATALPGLLEPMMLAQGAAPQFAANAAPAALGGSPASMGGMEVGDLMARRGATDALAEVGGMDPRAMDMGHANFNNPLEKARLGMAKAMGNKPAMAMRGAGLLNSMGGGSPQGAPAQRPPSMQSDVQSSAQLMERLKRQQGGRSNFAGLLGQAIGGY